MESASGIVNVSCHLQLVSGARVFRAAHVEYVSQTPFGGPIPCKAVLTPSGNAEVTCHGTVSPVVSVASIRLSLSPSSATECFPAAVNVLVDALDSSGQVISGPYLDAGGNPLTITLALTDPSGSTSLSATALSAPTAITLTYDGRPASSATVSASAPGVTTRAATLDIAASTAHNLYVADRRFSVQLDDAVAVFPDGASGNAAPRLFDAPRSELANPFGIAVDGACNLYVSNNAAGTNIATGVSVFPVSSSGTTAPLRTFTDGTNTSPIPWGIAFDPDGNLAVAYQNSGFPGSFDEVAFFSPASSGSVAPLFQLTGSNTALASPGTVAFDPSGNLYVGNLGANNVTSYPAGAQGNVAPVRALTGDLTNAINNPGAVAVDSSGNIYVANDGVEAVFGVDSITVYAPGADGYPTPMRTITGPLTQLTNPAGLAVDAAGTLYVLNESSSANSVITVYAPGASGNVAPIRTIAGPSTGLGFSIPGSPLAVDGGGNVYVLDLSSPLYGRSILTFSPTADGDVAPIRAIFDPAATLNANHASALAVDSVGTVYVGSDNGLFGLPNSILVFAAGSNGSVAPTKTITSPLLAGDVSAVGVDGSGNVYALVVSEGLAPQDAVYVFAPTASGTSTPIRSLLAAASDEFTAASMAVDAAGDVFMTGSNNTGAFRNAVSVYSATTNGDATPTRVIRGGAQGVFSPAGLGFDAAGDLYVLNRGDQTVKVYAPGADGLAAPIRTIQGVPFLVSGLLVEADGTAYVSTTNISLATTSTSSGMILVYAPGASGLAAPVRTIAGSATELNIPTGMTFGP